jgi:hypothetical protein
MSKLNLFHVLLLLILTPLIRFPSYVQALLAAACTGLTPRLAMAKAAGVHAHALQAVIVARIRFVPAALCIAVSFIFELTIVLHLYPCHTFQDSG